MATTSPPTGKAPIVPFWRDVRVLGLIGQIIFMVLVLAGLGWLIRNFLVNAETQGLRLGYDFLNTTASFDIKEGLEFEATDSFGRALWVGVINTIRVSLIGIFLTTILALVVGVARLSNNWLVSKTALLYVELMRNVPLLVLLFFLYFGVVLKLPAVRDSIQPFGWPIYLNQRGVTIPGLVATSSFPIWLAFVVLALLLALVTWLIMSRQEDKTGRPNSKNAVAVLTFLLLGGLGWLVTSSFSMNQALIAAGSRNIEEFADFKPIYLARIDEEALRELGVTRATLRELNSVEAVANYRASLEAQLAEPGLEEAEVEIFEDRLDVFEDAAIILCGIDGSPALTNATNQLQQESISLDIEAEDNLGEASEKYAGNDCDLLVGSPAELAAVRAILDDPADHTIATVDLPPLILNYPTPAGFNIQGGSQLSPEFAALLAGLVLFTGAFAAEIVRAGILSVSKGQSEAARALGLSEGQRLRLIVLPQALRVIIPPMTSQYLNLTKNSSLAVAIAYPDLVAVGNTVMNNSGTEIQIIILFMITYLIISLTISAFLNWYNKKVALVER